MKYVEGIKLQVREENEWFKTTIKPKKDIITPFIKLYTDGVMIVCIGYASDGASGPAPNRKGNTRPATGHDALYELIRNGYLPWELWEEADVNCLIWLKREGAWRITQWLWRKALAYAGGKHALPENKRKILDTNDR